MLALLLAENRDLLCFEPFCLCFGNLKASKMYLMFPLILGEEEEEIQSTGRRM